MGSILERNPTARLWRALLPLLLALATGPQGGHAADPVAYSVRIAPTGETSLDSAVHDASTLISLRTTAPVGPFALLARARNDAARFQTALQSFGYYKGTVAITLAGRGLDNPGLLDALDAATTEVPVTVTLTLGPLFHLRDVDLIGDVPPGMQDRLGLNPGAPAQATDVLAAGARLLQALQGAGYALARVDPPQAVLDLGANTLDVQFAVQSGPRVYLGAISITGLERLHESYVRRRLELYPGERFDPARIEAAREDLASTGVLSTVRIDPAASLDAQGRLPLQVQVTERPRRAVTLSASWSTDQGGSLSASWTHRNLFGNAEQLTLSAAATELGGTDSRQPGYNIGAIYTIPDWLRRDQSLTFQVTGVREYLDAYDRTALLGGVTLRRKLTQELIANVGLGAEVAHVLQEDMTYDYSLLQLPLGVTWDSTHELLEPTHGVRAAATITPSTSLGHAGGSSFVIVQASAATYLDIGSLWQAAEGRSVLALRGLMGGVEGAGVFDIPPDQRFYGGGSATIRGYRFQSVGPEFPSGHPTGGTAIDAGTIELRQRIGTSWGAAAFIDAGQVSASAVPFTGSPRVGIGVGARYYTSIGPIRLDLAVPLIHQNKSDSFDAYIGIGEAF